MSKKENKFKSELKKDLKNIFPDCALFDLDPNQQQGVPDLLVLYKSYWAMLECKRNAKSSHRPNQDYFINKFNEMSYASFIYPENKEEVLNALESTFNGRK